MIVEEMRKVVGFNLLMSQVTKLEQDNDTIENVVIVIDVFVQHAIQMFFIDNNHVVKTLSAKCPEKPCLAATLLRFAKV